MLRHDDINEMVRTVLYVYTMLKVTGCMHIKVYHIHKKLNVPIDLRFSAIFWFHILRFVYPLSYVEELENNSIEQMSM